MVNHLSHRQRESHHTANQRSRRPKEVGMRSPALAIAALLLLGVPGKILHAQQNPCDHASTEDETRIVVWPLPAQWPCEHRTVSPPQVRAEQLSLSVRPDMLAYHIDSIA